MKKKVKLPAGKVSHAVYKKYFERETITAREMAFLICGADPDDSQSSDIPDYQKTYKRIIDAAFSIRCVEDNIDSRGCLPCGDGLLYNIGTPRCIAYFKKYLKKEPLGIGFPCVMKNNIPDLAGIFEGIDKNSKIKSKALFFWAGQKYEKFWQHVELPREKKLITGCGALIAGSAGGKGFAVRVPANKDELKKLYIESETARMQEREGFSDLMAKLREEDAGRIRKLEENHSKVTQKYDKLILQKAESDKKRKIHAATGGRNSKGKSKHYK